MSAVSGVAPHVDAPHLRQSRPRCEHSGDLQLQNGADREGIGALDKRQAGLIQHAGVGIARLDRSGRFVLVNDQLCRLFGYTRQELLTRQQLDLVCPDERPEKLRALKEAVESGLSRTIELRYLRNDGASIWLSISLSSDYCEESQAPYLWLVAHDITAHKSAERAFATCQANLRMVLDSAADAFCAIDRGGAITLCNATFLRMTGLCRNEEVVGRDFHRLTHHSRADGSPLPRAECPVLNAAQTGQQAHVSDGVFFRADGSSFPVEYWARPVFREGRIAGAACTFVDITERRQAEARQQLLHDELVHRMKNTLTVVQAIVSQTLRNSDDPQDAVRSINARLFALSQAHDVLVRMRWERAPITEVVRIGIAAHGRENSRIRIDGPPMDVGPRTALALTMVLHELCVNAIKYGALSNDTGNVVVHWTLTGRGDLTSFHLRWTERGGPSVVPPARAGFGSRIIGEYCKSDLGGDATLLFEPEGLEWILNAPLGTMKR